MNYKIDKGFSLLEVVIALLIISITFLAKKVIEIIRRAITTSSKLKPLSIL
mgnify:CR=1 FL=1